MLHGSRTFVLQDDDGQTIESHAISAGLDYPGVGPEHAWLHETGRARYEPVDDAEAMEAFRLLCRTEGIIPAIESAHALAGAIREGQRLGPGAVIWSASPAGATRTWKPPAGTRPAGRQERDAGRQPVTYGPSSKANADGRRLVGCVDSRPGT